MAPPTETRAFAKRVRVNLDAIDAVASVAPAKAHQVTQLVLSLIGLIVLPRANHYLEAAGDATLPSLAAQGWPSWTIVEDLSRRPDGASDTLGDLLWHLRSTIASGQIRMTGEALAAGPSETILVVIGQFMVSSIPKEVGYKEIRVIGQLMAPRGSESVLAAKLTQVNGQTIYLPENARMVFGDERIGRQFLSYLDDRTAFVVFGNLAFESDVDADSVREKVGELVVLGDVEGPKELVPLLQVLARERYGNIRASG